MKNLLANSIHILVVEQFDVFMHLLFGCYLLVSNHIARIVIKASACVGTLLFAGKHKYGNQSNK